MKTTKKIRIDKDLFRNLYTYSIGLIHTYENYEDALENAVKLSFWCAGYMIIYKCQIPKNTEYCYGLRKYNKYPQYASKKINFVEDMDIVTCGKYNGKILKKGDKNYKEIIDYIKKKTKMN